MLIQKTQYNQGDKKSMQCNGNQPSFVKADSIVSYKEDSKLKCAAHTEPHKWKSVYNIVREQPANGIRIYKMK